MSKSSMSKIDLFEQSVVKSLFSLALPIIGANILQTAYQLTDMFWVGRLGTEAIAAVSLSFPVMFLLMSLGGGLAIAGTILVAQYKGKKQQESVDHIATQTLLMMFLVSIPLAIIGYMLSAPILTFIGA